MVVTLSRDALADYPRFSLYNSPYPAHDAGCAVDLYPGAVDGERAERAPSPVAGEVLDVRTTDAPSKPYAAPEEHLLLVDTGDHVARILHVEPSVEPGDEVSVGDPLGALVRSGYFAPWVDNHLHLGFREHDANSYRASGSLPLSVDAAVEGVAWDGTGTVVETGETYALLDSPRHPAPGERFVALAADDGTPLDGGLVHYTGGGALGPPVSGPLSLLGTEVGVADGRDVAWADVAVRANGERVTGLSLFAAREQFGVKVVAPDHGFAVGDRIEVSIEPTDDPVRLG